MTFDRWEGQARIALAERGIGYHEATPLIQDARAHYEQSGRDPWQVLGPPDEFAADVAADQPAAQAQLDSQGKTARDYLGDALFTLAFLGVMGALSGAWTAGSLTIPVTVAGLTGCVLAALGLVSGQAAPGALRASGHPRLATWGFAACAVLVVAAGVAFTQLPRVRIGEMHVLGVLAVSIGLGWLLTRPARAKGSTGPPLRGTGSHNPTEPEAWFARLRSLLIGRFDVPAARATALVDEARAHVAAAGSTPIDEFSSVARYARELAEGEPVRRGPWWRGKVAGLLSRMAVPVLLVLLITQAFLDGDLWIATGGAAILLWSAWDLLRRAVGDSG